MNLVCLYYQMAFKSKMEADWFPIIKKEKNESLSNELNYSLKSLRWWDYSLAIHIHACVWLYPSMNLFIFISPCLNHDKYLISKILLHTSPS